MAFRKPPQRSPPSANIKPMNPPPNLVKSSSDDDPPAHRDCFDDQHQQAQKDGSDMFRHFDRYNLEMVVRDINVDFVDEEEIVNGNTKRIEFTAGVSVIVKLVYDNFNHHEQLGYGIAKSDTRGKSVLDAKRKALEDACKRCSKMFGDIHTGHTILQQNKKKE